MPFRSSSRILLYILCLGGPHDGVPPHQQVYNQILVVGGGTVLGALFLQVIAVSPVMIPLQAMGSLVLDTHHFALPLSDLPKPNGGLLVFSIFLLMWIVLTPPSPFLFFSDHVDPGSLPHKKLQLEFVLLINGWIAQPLFFFC